MAIRAGAGGLKYPLPNFAQLAAQQSAAAASAGGSASASAYGANRQFAANKMRVQADLANAAAERDFRARSQMEEQGFRAIQGYMDRELGDKRQRDAQDFRAGQAELDRRFTAERDEAKFDMDQAAFEREVDAGIEKDIQAGKLELNEHQQQTLRELDDVGPKELGSFDAEQRAEFEQQRAERRRELIRSARPSQGAGTFNKGISYVDTTPDSPTYGQAFPEMAPGRQPYKADGTPLIDKSGEMKQQQALEKERIKQQKEQQVADQKRREAEQALNDEIYKEAKDLKESETSNYTDIGSARDAILKERRSVGASAPEAAPANPETPAWQGAPAPGMTAPWQQAQPTPATAAPGQVPLPAGHPNAGKQAMAGSPAAPPTQGTTPGWQGPPGPLGQMPTPMSAQERDALPPGSYYLTPTGEMRQKK